MGNHSAEITINGYARWIDVGLAGNFPNGKGNLNSVTQDVTSFELGSDKPSTAQWGTAIQMPMLLGLPADSEVNLVVASEAGQIS